MRNVFTIIDELSAGLAELKRALQPLAAFSTGIATDRSTRGSRRGRRRRKATARKTATKVAGRKRRASKKPTSPKVRAQRVQQGKYMAALRSLSVQQRAQVKKAKAEGDYGSALKLAASLRSKSA